MASLSGREGASGGDVRGAGIEYGPLNEDGRARGRRGSVGIGLQSFHLLPTMTSVEKVAVPLEIAGASDAFARAAAELEAGGLGQRLHHYPAQLSGGEQQRCAIARAVAPRRDILYADETTGNLDGRTSSASKDPFISRRAVKHAPVDPITPYPALPL